MYNEPLDLKPTQEKKTQVETQTSTEKSEESFVGPSPRNWKQRTKKMCCKSHSRPLGLWISNQRKLRRLRKLHPLEYYWGVDKPEPTEAPPGFVSWDECIDFMLCRDLEPGAKPLRKELQVETEPQRKCEKQLGQIRLDQNKPFSWSTISLKHRQLQGRRLLTSQNCHWKPAGFGKCNSMKDIFIQDCWV